MEREDWGFVKDEKEEKNENSIPVVQPMMGWAAILISYHLSPYSLLFNFMKMLDEDTTRQLEVLEYI